MPPVDRTLASFAILLSLVLTACTQNSQQTFDQQFIDMMVPHHQGALVMATIAQSRSQRPEIKQLATSILASQKTEIDQMKQWRKVWYGSDQTPPMTRMPMVPGMGGEHGGHGTMNMQADVDALRRAGDPFDKAFIDMMIPHHQSAIDAAKVVESKTQRAEVRDLAKAIIADQQREIDQMKQWRMAWYGSATPGS